MSVNHGSIATHVPQSLPSFAQAFSTQSLGSISSGNNSLPPIQTRLLPMEHRRLNSPSIHPGSEDGTGIRTTSRKRTRNDVTSNTRDDEHSNSDGSPRLIHIKEEQDQDMLEPTPPPQPPRASDQRSAVDTGGAPPPSSLRPSPSKKRRVTVSGGPHPLNTDVRVPLDQTNSTPISPVVMGFTIKRDNPSAIEQVRSMITVKQKQKALIEQRRGSVAGIMSPSTVTSNTIPPSPADERNLTSSKPLASTRPLRRSPNTGTSSRRLTNASSHGGGNPGPSSPIIIAGQQPLSIPSQSTSTHSLPPPPISFAKRRASQLGSGKKKPADIMISPREAQTQEQFQPAIQSAPPVPHAGQSSFYSGRYPMALPRLPSVMGGGDNIRRIASNVPPTPTRLSMMQRTASSTAATPPISGMAGRSPPAASVPIASTLIPPTPGLFNRPGYSGDKAAFLAPFEVFYDALNDSKQLKSWLGEQLQRSNAMMQTLTQQQEKLDEVVESLVEQKVAGMRSEISGLHRRVEELEDALRIATSGHRHSSDSAGGVRQKGKYTMRNGVAAVFVTPDTYTFPSVSSAGESSRRRPERERLSSPGWGQDREHRDSQNMPESEHGSPAPDSSRMSVSASRLDPPRAHHLEPPHPRSSSSQSRHSFGIQSPPQGFRDSPNYSLQGKQLQGPSHSERERPSLSRQHSAQTPAEQQVISSPPLRRSDSRRNSASVIMSPPDGPGEDNSD